MKFKFEFTISVYPSKLIADSSSFQKKVPNCIAKNTPCAFITSDSAIAISKRDKIYYPKNLSLELRFDEQLDDFVWIVTGNNPNEPKFGRKRRSPELIRHINATSGEIATKSLKDY